MRCSSCSTASSPGRWSGTASSWPTRRRSSGCWPRAPSGPGQRPPSCLPVSATRSAGSRSTSDAIVVAGPATTIEAHGWRDHDKRWWSVEQLDGDEPELALADVLKVMDQRLVRRVLGVVRVTDVVLTGDHRPVGGALAADAAVDRGPEVAAGVGVERAALTGLQPHLPDPDAVV